MYLNFFLSRLYNMETAKNCFKRRHHASVIYFVLEWNEINPSRALVWNLKVLGERVNESCFPICHVRLMLQKGLITVFVKTYWSKKTKKLVLSIWGTQKSQNWNPIAFPFLWEIRCFLPNMNNWVIPFQSYIPTLWRGMPRDFNFPGFLVIKWNE